MKCTFKLFFFLCLLLFLFVSCRSQQLSESNFIKTDLLAINGKYFSHWRILGDYFNIALSKEEHKTLECNSICKGKAYNEDDIPQTSKWAGVRFVKGDTSSYITPKEYGDTDYFILSFNGTDILRLSYRDNDVWYTIGYRGKLKKNHFEISIQNTQLPFLPLFSRYDVDRIKIGIDANNNILVYNFSKHYGTFLLFGAHSDDGTEHSVVLKRVDIP